MCGIIGYLGPKRTDRVLLSALRKLEYRGYDSAGLCVVEGEDFYTCKEVGKVSNLEKSAKRSETYGAGIAHTRWATHGGVTKENAHPHISQCNRIAIVHNGIIENFSTIKEKLCENGAVFKSDTDSEVICTLISNAYNGLSPLGDSKDCESSGDPILSISEALKILKGTWGLGIIFLDHPDEIYAARNGSPLIVGFDSESMFLSSDPHAITKYTKDILFLEDGDVARITLDDAFVFSSNGDRYVSEFKKIEDSWGTSDLGEFENFMIKEVYEQPDAIRHCLAGRIDIEAGNSRLGGLGLTHSFVNEIKKVTFLGCGTSYYASQIGARLSEQFLGVQSFAEISSEYRYKNIPIDRGDVFFAVTQSGETADTLAAIKEIQMRGGEVNGIVNVVGSTIARRCGKGSYIHSGPEMSVASTKAFSNMVVTMTLFAIQAGRFKGMGVRDGSAILNKLSEIPEKIESFLSELKAIGSKNNNSIMEAAKIASKSKCVIFLGKGISSHVASEGALKLMEIAYVPCLAYPSGELKHGPIALIEEGTLVVVVAPRDDLQQKALSGLQECKARGAKICLICTKGDDIARHADIVIEVSDTDPNLTPLLTVIPLQLIAYNSAIILSRDVDRPRNLAKSVTVD